MFAAGVSQLDSPLPGPADAVALGIGMGVSTIYAGFLLYETYKNLTRDGTGDVVVPITTTQTENNNLVRVRHHTSPVNLAKIKHIGIIGPGGQGGLDLYGVDVEVAPFGPLPDNITNDFRSQTGAYVEFYANKNELIPIPNTGYLTFNGRNTARIVTAIMGVNMPSGYGFSENTKGLSLFGRDPKYVYVNWWDKIFRK